MCTPWMGSSYIEPAVLKEEGSCCLIGQDEALLSPEHLHALMAKQPQS